MAQHEGFSDEQIAQRARENANGFLLGSIVYLKENGHRCADWASYLGGRFAGGWDPVKGRGAMAAMEQVALNVASLGADVESLTGDQQRAELVFGGWPQPELIEFMGVSRAEALEFLHAFEPIAEYLGLEFHHETQDTRVTATMTAS